MKNHVSELPNRWLPLVSPLLSPLSLRRRAAHLSRSPASTAEKKVTTRSIAWNGKQKRRKALPPSSSKKRKKLGEVVYFVFSLPLLFLSYLLSCFVCGRVSEYLGTTWQTHKTDYTSYYIWYIDVLPTDKYFVLVPCNFIVFGPGSHPSLLRGHPIEHGARILTGLARIFV